MSEAAVAGAFQDHQVRLPPGRHLHWSLPDGLTREGHDGFPPVPNRWLVTSSATGAQWVVESDHLLPVGAAPTEDCVPYPRDPTEGGPPYRYLGRVLPRAEWETDEARHDPTRYLAPGELTATGYGEPTFAALYAGCRGVFGMWDDSPGAADIDTTYHVLGWYSDPTQDPLQRLRREAGSGDLRAAVREHLGWDWDAKAEVPERTVVWGRARVGSLTPLATGHRAVTVAVGATGVEALSAFLARELQDGFAGIDVEDMLERAQLGGRLDRTPDGSARFHEQRHQNGFVAEDGGASWSVEVEGAAAAAGVVTPDVPPDPPRERPHLPPEVADLLGAANRLQAAYDRERRELAGLRSQLFADWYRYVLATYEPVTADAPLPDPDRIRDVMERGLLPRIEVAAARTGDLAVRTDDGGVHLLGFEGTPEGSTAGRLAEVLRTLSSAVTTWNADPAVTAAKISHLLSRGPAPRFWRPGDPVVLVTGPDVTPSLRHGQDGRLRVDGLLDCDVPPDPPVGEPPADPAAWTATVDGLPPARIGFVGDGDGVDDGSWNPLLLQWEVEVFPARPSRPLEAPDGHHRAPEGGPDLTPDHLTATAELPLDSPDLRPLAPEYERGAHLYHGTSILTPHPRTQLNHVLDGEVVRLVKPVLLARFFATTGVPAHARDDAGVLEVREDWNTWIAGQLDGPPPGLPEPDPEPDARTPTEQLDAWLREVSGELAAWRATGPGAAPLPVPATTPATAPVITPGTAPATTPETVPAAAPGATADVAVDEDERSYLQVLAAAIGLLHGTGGGPGTSVLAQSLEDFHDALLTRRRGFQFSVRDPFAFDDQQDFVDRVRTAVAHAGDRAPRPLDDFLPLRSGGMDLVRLHVIDTFGRRRALRWDRVVASAPMSPRDTRFPVLLPPRLAAPARLDLRWLPGDAGTAAVAPGGGASPICGWLVADFVDGSVVVFDADGSPLGSVTDSPTAPWRSAPGALARPSVTAIPSPALRRVVRWLLARRKDVPGFLDGFLGVVERAFEDIEPDSAVHPSAQALLVSRPLAVVRASMRLETDGPLPVDQSWNALRRDLTSPQRDTHGLGALRVPTRLGEHRQLRDGLVGFWHDGPDGADEFPLPTFHAAQGDVHAESEVYEAGGQLDTSRLPTPNGAPQSLCLLFDPRGSLHATCGVLPTKEIDIPADAYAPALRAIEVPFLTAPLLTERGLLQISLPDEPGSQWSWLERRPDGWAERAARGRISREQVAAAFGAHAPDVWAALVAQKWITPDAADVTADVVPPTQRRSQDLHLPDAQVAVEAFLAAAGITPFRLDAAFAGPVELREGWLTLRAAPATPGTGTS